MARLHEEKGDLDAAASFFRECAASGEDDGFRSRCLLGLCGVLKASEEWKELETLAENALQLSQTCGDDRGCASCYLFLTQAALSRKEKDVSEQRMQAVLDTAFPDAGLSLAHGDKVLKYVRSVLEDPLTQGRHIPVESDPMLYIRMLDALHDFYFADRQYLQAFQAKQEKYSLEQQFGFRAFVGAGRLRARRMPFAGEIPLTEEIEASGRRDDIQKLVDKLGEAQCRVIVFHGESGVGKSSILEAGLYPKLRKEGVKNYPHVVPILIRSYGDWAGEILKALRVLNRASGGKPDKSLKTTEDMLTELREFDKQGIRTVLIFDQFEEFFFEHGNPKERRDFYDFIQTFLKINSAKLIFSLREDYIHYLLECDRRVEFDILSKSFRMSLGNFDREGAKSVIQSLTRRSQFTLDDSLIERIVDDLAEDADGVRPIELQIVGSQIEAKGIHRHEELRLKAELVQAFLKDAVQDCGTENEDAARLILWLLTDENLTRPLKTRAEIEYELNALLRDTGIEVGDGQLRLVLEILTRSGMIFLVHGESEKYQLVHDYLTGLIREDIKPLFERLSQERNEREYERRLAEQEEKREREEAEKERKRAEKERKRQQRQLRMAVVAGVAFAVLAAIAILFGVLASKNFLQAKQAEQKAIDNLLQAKYNLAKGFEEKAGLLLDNAKNADDFQKAWLFTLAALQQDIGNKKLPASLRRLACTELRWVWLL